jgi:hypothetical protein
MPVLIVVIVVLVTIFNLFGIVRHVKFELQSVVARFKAAREFGGFSLIKSKLTFHEER